MACSTNFSVITPFKPLFAMAACNAPNTHISADRAIPDWVALVREKVEGLRFGVVQLVIHEGRVTQIERTEKTRLTVIREQAAE